MRITQHWDIYSTQLANHSFGRALWEPNPRANGEDSPVEVGDVGYIRYGGFHRLFNVLLPADHPAHNSLGVPDKFVPLKPSGKVTYSRTPIMKGPLHSVSVRTQSASMHLSAGSSSLPLPTGEFSFSCSKEQGAALILFDKAYRKDLLAGELFEECFINNYESWLAFAYRHRRGIRLNDLILVTGCDTTSQWAMAAFSHAEFEAKAKGGVEVPGLMSATFDLSSGWKTQGIVHGHSGPEAVEPPSARSQEGENSERSVGHPVYDQCVFVRGYSLRRNYPFAPKIIRAAAGPYDLGSGGRDNKDEGAVLSGDITSESSEDLNMLSPILSYILNEPGIELAIAHDDDLQQYVGESADPDVVYKNLQEERPNIIIKNRVGKINRVPTFSVYIGSSSEVGVGADVESTRNQALDRLGLETGPTTSRSLHSEQTDISTLASTADQAEDVKDGFEERRNVIKIKIRAIGRIMRVFTLLREESDKVSEIKSLSRSGKVPYGTLVLGPEGIKEVTIEFEASADKGPGLGQLATHLIAAMSEESGGSQSPFDEESNGSPASMEYGGKLSLRASSRSPPPYSTDVQRLESQSQRQNSPSILVSPQQIGTSTLPAMPVTEVTSQVMSAETPTYQNRKTIIRTKISAFGQFSRALSQIRIKRKIAD